MLGRFQFGRTLEVENCTHTPCPPHFWAKAVSKAETAHPALKLFLRAHLQLQLILKKKKEKKKNPKPVSEQKNINLQRYQRDFFVCFQVKLVKLHPIPKHDPEAS